MECSGHNSYKWFIFSSSKVSSLIIVISLHFHFILKIFPTHSLKFIDHLSIFHQKNSIHVRKLIWNKSWKWFCLFDWAALTWNIDDNNHTWHIEKVWIKIIFHPIKIVSAWRLKKIKQALNTWMEFFRWKKKLWKFMNFRPRWDIFLWTFSFCISNL